MTESIKSSLRERVILQSIRVLRQNGVSNPEIKKTIIEKFLLSEKTADKLIAQS